jgi:hypothetical protein
MTGPLALSPLESLLRLSPLACAQALLIAFLTGELAAFYAQVFATSTPTTHSPAPSPYLTSKSTPTVPTPSAALTPLQTLLVLSCNGLLAFVLNIASFSTNKRAGALTMTVCGNVKQCLTVLLGIALFGVRVGLPNGLGMAVALGGAAWYSVVELGRKTTRGGGA